VDANQFDNALAVLERVEQKHPATPGLAALITNAKARKAALDAETRRDQEIGEALTQAAVEFSAGRLTEARQSLERVLALAPGHQDGLSRLRQVDAAIEAQRRQAELDREAQNAIEAARRQFEDRHHDAAIASLDAFPRESAAVARARDELIARRAVIDRERQDAERRARIENARKAVAQAREALWQRQFDDTLIALDQAEALDPGNPDIAPLRARALAGREETGSRVDGERLEREALARERRRQAEALASALTQGRQALDAGDFDLAARLADEALPIDAGSDAQVLKARAIEGQTRHREAAERATRL
jgi:hypothetical protein